MIQEKERLERSNRASAPASEGLVPPLEPIASQRTVPDSVTALRRLVRGGGVFAIVIGALVLSIKDGWFSSESGSSLLVIIAAVILTVLMWRNARAVDKADARTAHAEAERDRLHTALESRIAEQAADLVVAKKELSMFSLLLSHDLRAPLRSIDGFVNSVVRDCGENLPAEAQHYLGRVNVNVQRMNQLIDNILKFVRFSQRPVSRMTVSMEALVHDCLEQLHSEQGERLVEYRIGRLPACQADPSLLYHVLLNLLGNALKYTRGRERAVIEVGVFRDGTEAVYYVRDNGIGFDMKHVDRLFNVFQRLHREDEYEGTGVGLAIVQRLIYRHGGRIWAEGYPGNGSTFYFTLGV